MASAYKQYCADKGVRAVSVFVPQTLGDMIDAVKARDDVKESQLVRSALAEYVNNAGLTRDDGTPWQYAEITPENARETIARQQRELEELKALLRAQQVPPTPPAQIADARTGELVSAAAD